MAVRAGKLPGRLGAEPALCVLRGAGKSGISNDDEPSVDEVAEGRLKFLGAGRSMLYVCAARSGRAPCRVGAVCTKSADVAA